MKGRPPFIPGMVLEILEEDGQIESMFDLSFRRIGCSYPGLFNALRKMEHSNQIKIKRVGNGRPVMIQKVQHG